MSTPLALQKARLAHQAVTGEKWCYLCTKYRKVSAFSLGLRCCDECQGKKRKPRL